jgi:O-Antigen ligase
VSALVFTTFALLGIGRNLPWQGLYFFGLGLADLLLLVCLLAWAVSARSRAGLWQATVDLRVPIAAVSGLGVLAALSMAFNSFVYGVEPRDLFEVMKYYYQLLVMVAACHASREGGAVPVVGFASGVIVSGVVAMLNPMNPDVLGTPQIFNPNVIGNVLAVAVVLASFAILRGQSVTGGALAVLASIIGFFTFSKGTWLMLMFGLLACAVALARNGSTTSAAMARLGRVVAVVLLLGLAGLVVQNWELVSLIVEAKIAATEFDASAAEGGSFSARFGLMLSAFQMFLSNPLFGVGISNFEQVNRQLELELGDAFYDDDNPNSAWFYVLGCMGGPAFVLFAAVFVWFVMKLLDAPIEGASMQRLYAMCVACVFLIGGNVQLEMLTAYYYWVAIGALTALSRRPGSGPARITRLPQMATSS